MHLMGDALLKEFGPQGSAVTRVSRFALLPPKITLPTASTA